jgi:DNA helicase HerA-like ATPase
LSHEPRHTRFVIAAHDGEPLALDDDTRLRQFYIIGQTGTGKTTLIKHMVAQDLAAGSGIALIDPLGQLAEAVLALVPARRAHELAYLNPTDLERPIGLNVLENAHSDEHANIADDILAAFIHIWTKEAVGDHSQQVLRNSIRALLYSQSSRWIMPPRGEGRYGNGVPCEALRS